MRTDAARPGLRNHSTSYARNLYRNNMIEIPKSLIECLHSAQHVIVFTGAGVSAESGIPTFRDDKTGLWKRYVAQNMATADGFLRDPELSWGWHEWLRAEVMKAQPNPAHIAIAKMAKRVPQLTVITQNIDDLHERAGNHAPIHLHGSMFKFRCIDCHLPFTMPPGIPEGVGEGVRLTPPRCPSCCGLIRPGVVWFGDFIPGESWEAAMSATEREACDVFFSIGTSLTIYPVAELPFEAARQGATVIQINPASTKLDKFATYNLQGAVGEILPILIRSCWPDDQDSAL